MQCHQNCAVCCTNISISSPIPGMPLGKKAGIPCIHLTEDKLCAIYTRPERPEVCSSFSATPEFCGSSPHEALALLTALEASTTG